MPSRTNTCRNRSWLFRFFSSRPPVPPRSSTSHSIEALESRIAPASLASVATSKASGADATDEGAIAAQVGAPSVTVTAGPSVAEDGNGTITFTFTRQGPSTAPLTASFNVTGAATSSDYTLTGSDLTAFNPATGAGAVTFAAGSSTATVVVNPIDDSTVEPDEQVTFNVLAGTGGYIVGTPGSDTAFILNDDTDVRIIVSPGSISEDGGGSLLYTLVRSGVTSTSLTVNFSLSGLAVPGTDYDVLNATSFSPSKGVGTVTFLPESVTTSFSINPKADNVQEADETAIVTVTNGAGYNVVGPGAAGLITNDDSTVTVAVNPGAVAEDGKTDLVYTFTRTGYTGNILTVDFSVGGTASFGGPGADYSQLGAQTYTATAGTATFVDGAGTTTVTIHPLADTTAEADETVILTLANSGGSSTGGYTSAPPDTATGTIVNDDAAVSVAIGSTPVLESSTTGLVYTFTRTGDSSVPLSINFTSNGTAAFGADYAAVSSGTLNFAAHTLIIPAGSTSATVTLTPIDDRSVEGTESAILGVATGSGYVVSGSPATGSITDNDTATISFATGTSIAPEGVSPHSFDVKLVTTANGVVGAGTLAGPVSVDVSVPSGVAGGTATGGGIDYTFPTTFNVAFAAGTGDSAKAVPVSITNDQLSEANETVNFNLSASSNTIGGSLVIDPGTHTTTIVDNDADLTINLTGSAGPVIAGSGPNNLAYTVTLTNSGKTDATNVVVAELFTLPAGVTFSGATPGAGVFDSTTGTWTVAALAGNGGIATLNLNFTADHSTANSATATITASATSADQALVNTSDDSANASVAIARQGDLSVVVTDSPDPAGPLQQLTYTIVVSNTGPSDSSGAILRDTFPATFRTVTWTALFANGGAGSTSGSGDINEILSLPAGGNAVYTVTGTVAALAANSVLSNTATVSGPRAQDLNPANDSATEQTAISGIDLQLTEDDSLTSVQPGDVIKYTLTYLNAAFVTATGAKITDLVPLNTIFDAADSTAGWTGVVDGSPAGTIARFDLGTLAADTTPGSIVFAVRVTDTVAAGQSSIAHNATISDDGLHGLDRNSSNDSASDIDTLVAAPDFHILKTLNGVDVQTDGGLVARRGAAVTYTLTYSNEGNQDASGVVITQTLPANTFFAGGPGWNETSPGSGVYRYDAGTLAAKDGTHTVPFRVLVNSVLPNHLTELSTTASIDDGGINGLDPTLDDDSKTDTTPVYQGIYAVTPGVTVPKGFGPPSVLVFDAATGAKIASFLAYEPHIRASIRIAVGDFNDDGFDDIITSSAKGTGRVRVFLADSFTGTTFTQSGDEIAAFDGRKTIGAFIAVGDVNGDRQDDIIVGSALGSGRMKVFDGISHTPLLDLKPFGSSFTGGVRVAAGDVDGDGIADIIAGQGFEGGRVKVYQGESKFGEAPALGSTILHDFYVGGQSYQGGVSVAAGDLNGDGRADIITGRNSYSKPLVQTFDGTTHSLLKSFLALPGSYANGIRVAAADVNLDGIADIIVGAGFDGGSQVKIFDGANDQALGSLSAYPTFPKMALWVAGTAEVPIANRRGD